MKRLCICTCKLPAFAVVPPMRPASTIAASVPSLARKAARHIPTMPPPTIAMPISGSSGCGVIRSEFGARREISDRHRFYGHARREAGKLVLRRAASLGHEAVEQRPAIAALAAAHAGARAPLDVPD